MSWLERSLTGMGYWMRKVRMQICYQAFFFSGPLWAVQHCSGCDINAKLYSTLHFCKRNINVKKRRNLLHRQLLVFHLTVPNLLLTQTCSLVSLTDALMTRRWKNFTSHRWVMIMKILILGKEPLGFWSYTLWFSYTRRNIGETFFSRIWFKRR